jgi:hypothetical protein
MVREADARGLRLLLWISNRDVQVPAFGATAHKCNGVFETLNMITRMLLHKFISEGNRAKQLVG